MTNRRNCRTYGNFETETESAVSNTNPDVLMNHLEVAAMLGVHPSKESHQPH